MRLIDLVYKYIFSSCCIGFLFSLLLIFPESSQAETRAARVKTPNQSVPNTARKHKKKKEGSGWFLIGNLAGAFNGPGVRIIARGGYQWRLYPHKHMAFKNNFIRLNLISQATPANIGAGPNVTIQPASFIRFGLNYSFRYYFPAFSVGTAFKDMDAVTRRFKGRTDWSDGERRMREQREDVTARNNGRIGLSAQIIRLHWLVQLRVKGFVAQHIGAMQFWFTHFEDVDQSKLMYEAGNDLIIRRQDQVFTSFSIFGYEWKQFRFLVVNSYQYALQSKEESLGLGPAIQWVIAPKLGIMKNPYLLVAVRWWVRHRYRSGALPNFALVFQADFDV